MSASIAASSRAFFVYPKGINRMRLNVPFGSLFFTARLSGDVTKRLPAGTKAKANPIPSADQTSMGALR